MRFFEFEDHSLETFVIVLKNFIGRASSKKVPAKLNWHGLNQVLKSSGASITADYETFKSMYDSSPIIQKLVKNFNDDGIELNVPGAPDSEKEPTQGNDQSSQTAVDQAAATAAPQQLAQQTATPQI